MSNASILPLVSARCGRVEVYFPTGSRICLDQRKWDASALRGQTKNQSGSKKTEEKEKFVSQLLVWPKGVGAIQTSSPEEDRSQRDLRPEPQLQDDFNNFQNIEQ